ncbi:tRNA wybutosine-synthesizing protein 3 homolog isoform X2 [Rhinoraja longicauda]
MAAFSARKQLRLRPGADSSRKGRVDAALRALLALINGSAAYSSCSSCSGRLLLLAGTDETEGQKQNCPWLFVTHEKCQKEDVVAGLQAAQDNAVFKFEPFILHVECRAVEDAQLLHSAAVNSGFRNSGITISKKGKIMMAVRSTHCLEVPLCHRGQVLVSEDYIEYLVQVANRKMEENQRRIDRFHACLRSMLDPAAPEGPSEADVGAAAVYTRRRRRQTAARRQGDGEETSQSDANLL